MNIKKLLVLALVLGCSFSAFGQDVQKPVNTETYWFGGVGGGMNFGFNGHQYAGRDNSGAGAGFAVDVYAGKWFNQWGGFRVGYQGLGTSDVFTSFGKDPYTYVHGDMLFRAAKWFIPYVHLGYAKINKGSFAGGVGVALPINVSKRIAIVPDFKATGFNNQAFTNGGRFPGMNLSVTLGLRVNLGGKSAQTVTVPVETVRYVRDTVVVHEKEIDTVYIQVIKEKASEFNDELAGITLFDFDKSTLRNEAFPVLDKIAAWLNDNPERTALIDGYTDYRGTDAYNLRLSQRRADSVLNYLVQKGVDKARLTAVGHGKGKFTEGNTDDEVRQQNRRVVVTFK